MSVKIMSRVWEDAPYEGGKLLVLLALADWANDEGWAWPGMARLAKKSRLEERHTRSLVHELEADGVLAIETGGGRGKQNRYQIKVQNLPGLSDTETRQSSAQRGQSSAQTRQPRPPDPLVEPLVNTTVTSRAREGDYKSTGAGSRSAILAARPEGERKPRSRRPLKPHHLPPGFQPDLDVVIEMLHRMGVVNVDGDELLVAVEQWELSRRAAGKQMSDWQADCQSFISIYANNHWREKKKPDFGNINHGGESEPEEEEDNRRTCMRCHVLGVIRFTVATPPIGVTEPVCPKCLTLEERASIGEDKVRAARITNNEDALRRKAIRVAEEQRERNYG